MANLVSLRGVEIVDIGRDLQSAYDDGYRHGYQEGLMKGLEQLIKQEQLSVRPIEINIKDKNNLNDSTRKLLEDVGVIWWKD